ncbi:hypothetical protein KDW82_25595 [Burkholderia vietnamiensis]|nr:hypothetical protein [Burkholderia vietnamiensis]
MARTYGISRANVLAVVNPKVAGAARFRARNRIVLHATFKALLSRKLLTQRLFTGIIALRNLGMKRREQRDLKIRARLNSSSRMPIRNGDQFWSPPL